jgi:UDPglucose 6-dehydrogenase
MTVSMGVIGMGYVGGAIINAANISGRTVSTYDIDINRNPNCKTIYELVNNSNIIYIAVPTPMDIATGKCDTSIVESVVDTIDLYSNNKILVIKSTVLPGTTELLQKKYKNNTILFSPEFLTEANYLSDFLEQDIMIMGYPNNVPASIAESALNHQRSLTNGVVNHYCTQATTAELYKYVANTFLATKVSFANEMATIATSLNIEWSTVANMIINDIRMGKTHWAVPGPDGHNGFGGVCLPKDISALTNISHKLGVPTPILDAVWSRNTTIDRPEKDWESLKGRAVN